MKPYDIRCACGQPLHYRNPAISDAMAILSRELGEFILVRRYSDGRAWMVQRHYIALHGLKEQDLGTDRIPQFEEVK